MPHLSLIFRNMITFKLKNDKYKKSRGGYSRILDIKCAKCGVHICFYQKDGPGIIKRLYLDRIFDMETKEKELRCSNCKSLIGIKFVYERENRPAYKMFVGAISKKIFPH